MKLTQKQKKDNEKWSGTIELDREDIVFKNQGKELNRFSLANIKAIGEMTTVSDPMTNDWNLVFVATNNELRYIPVYANNMESFLKQLSDRLGFEMSVRLASSIHLDSNIIYPKELAGQKLFAFRDAPLKNLLEKIGKFFGLGNPINAELTEEVKQYKNDS